MVEMVETVGNIDMFDMVDIVDMVVMVEMVEMLDMVLLVKWSCKIRNKTSQNYPNKYLYFSESLYTKSRSLCNTSQLI